MDRARAIGSSSGGAGVARRLRPLQTERPSCHLAVGRRPQQRRVTTARRSLRCCCCEVYSPGRPGSRVGSHAMGAAFGWGAVAASSLVCGMLLGLARSWPELLIGLVLSFGAGALISAVSFELFEEGVHVGGATAVGIGLALGAVVYFVLARAVEHTGPGGGGGGTALALG